MDLEHFFLALVEIAVRNRFERDSGSFVHVHVFDWVSRFVLAVIGDSSRVTYEHVDVLPILAMLQDVVVLRLTILYANYCLYQLVILLYLFPVPEKVRLNEVNT